jgi:hypothetical protein
LAKVVRPGAFKGGGAAELPPFCFPYGFGVMPEEALARKISPIAAVGVSVKTGGLQ